MSNCKCEYRRVIVRRLGSQHVRTQLIKACKAHKKNKKEEDHESRSEEGSYIAVIVFQSANSSVAV